MNRDLHSIRRDYQSDDLLEDSVSDEPFSLFDQWLDTAIEACPDDPTAMTLSTVDAQGWPDARIVLLKQRDNNGFSFFTNYDSEKGQQLAFNHQACLNFFWSALSRQIRIKGTVEKVSADISQAYFSSRPRDSQLAARASKQSTIIDGRSVLQLAFEQEESSFANQPEVPCPTNWGGYTLTPTYIEFWQGKPSRLHDRLCYIKQADGTWNKVRKAP